MSVAKTPAIAVRGHCGFGHVRPPAGGNRHCPPFSAAMVVEHDSWDALVEEQLEYEERLSALRVPSAGSR
eukprot:5252611-Lingulodinium_polyedra.AAC.1